MMNLYIISSNKFYFHFRTWSWGFFRSNCAIICKKMTVLNQNKNGEVLIVTLRRKSHRVAHEKSEAWWVLLILLYSIQCYCQDFFCKKQQSLFVLEVVLSFTFINSKFSEHISFSLHMSWLPIRSSKGVNKV